MARPTWIINGTDYYFRQLPPNFRGEPNGDLLIEMIDVSLNQTSFQCAAPVDNIIIFGDITILIVTAGNYINFAKIKRISYKHKESPTLQREREREFE